MTARLTRLRQAVEEGDGAAQKIEAHSIKGSAAQMGAEDLAALCTRLETEADAGEWRLTFAQVDALQALFDRLSAAIARHPLSRKP